MYCPKILFMDVNEEEPLYKIYIKYVGVEGVSIPFYTILGGQRINSILMVDAYIDLPHYLRGIHASRSLESIQEVIFGYKDMLMRVEDIASNISRELLIRHDYAAKSFVYVEGDILLNTRVMDSERYSLERFKIFGKGISYRDGEDIKSRKFVGVKLAGLTACPSAQRSTYKELGNIPQNLSPTHMQRGYLEIMVEEPLNMIIDIIKLIELGKESISSPTYELLKKEDEAKLIINTYNNPMFTEDVVRSAAYKLIKLLGENKDIEVYISYRSIESIHNHDLVAVIEGKLSELAEHL